MSAAEESDDELKHSRQLHENQPYDESLDIPDAEEVASQYTPTPRIPQGKGLQSDALDAGQAAQNRGDVGMLNLRRESDASGDGPENHGPEIMEPVQKATIKAENRLKPMTGDVPSAPPVSKPPKNVDDEENEEDESGDDDEEDDDDEDESGTQVEGAYNPADYEHLAVSAEIKELFQYITRYMPQNIELDTHLKPFIPDYIPAVGDIDAFIKIPRHDGKNDLIGLVVVDEPCAKQSDPVVLDLMLRSLTKQSNLKEVTIKSIDSADHNSKAIDNWIKSIGDLHRTKPAPSVHYSKNMPDIDTLMEEWPADIEELLKEITLPTGDIECELKEFVDMACSMVDIPVHKSRVQSLHLMFTLYAEFKNSQHFQALGGARKASGSARSQRADAEEEGSDRLTI